MPHKLTILLITAIFATTASTASASTEKSTFATAKNLEIFNSVYKQLSLHYVDTLNAEKTIRAGINGMLSRIDPYTAYIPDEQNKDFRFMTTGEYGGIGAIISYTEEYVIINDLYRDMPADKAGLLPGDKIAFVDGEDMKGKTTVEVSNKLKGTPGSEVEVRVLRRDESKPLKFNLMRENIYLSPVPYYGMVADSIGYICLDKFTDDCADEVKKAYLELKQQGMQKLIIDLTSNPGGLLNEACNIVNMFVPKGETVVTTKGRDNKVLEIYKTPSQPIDTEIPLAIMVDEHSASASEIVAGALQDMDRAVIVGKRTFGKGLVQGTFPVAFDGQLKVTTAKYYTPSGRCIQAIKYSANEDDGPAEIPDSLTTEFKTRAGRIVRDGRGITPDVDVEAAAGRFISYKLYADQYIFRFANAYHFKHPEKVPLDSMRISDDDYAEFKKFVLDEGFSYELPSSELLTELVESAKLYEVYEPNKALFDSLQAALKPDVAAELDAYKDEISRLLLVEIAKYHHYQQGEKYMALQDDDFLKAAIELLSDDKRYAEILSPK